MRHSYISATIPADSYIDLQTHTNLSDGKWTPEALIDYFFTENFATAAITDHDRVDTIHSLQQLAHRRGFPLLVAAEMTTRWRGSIVDILCFGFENNPAPLHALCERLHHDQTENSRQVYQNLIKSGHIPRYDETELNTLLNATTSQQPNLLFDLFEHYHPDKDDFTPLKKAGYKLCANPTDEVIQAAHECGAFALIAHAGRTDGFTTFDADLLDQFRAEIPIDGIEVYYPRHTAEQIATYEAYAKRHNLLISAGSDSHTPDQPPIKYRADQCTALLARLDIEVK